MQGKQYYYTSYILLYSIYTYYTIPLPVPYTILYTLLYTELHTILYLIILYNTILYRFPYLLQEPTVLLTTLQKHGWVVDTSSNQVQWVYTDNDAQGGKWAFLPLTSAGNRNKQEM